MKPIEFSEEALRAATLDEWKEIRETFWKLRGLFDTLDKGHQKQAGIISREAKLQALKALKPYTQLYYARNSSKIPYGSPVQKVKNGTKMMHVIFKGERWNIGYDNLSIVEPPCIEINRSLAKLFQ